MSRSFQLNNSQLKIVIWTLAAIVMVLMFVYRFKGESGDGYKRVIEGDGKGYYAYLPAVFIYHDLTFSFFDRDDKKFGYQYSNTFLLNHDKHNLDKYTCGEAILLIPFFLLAMLFSWLAGFEVDGYSAPFHVSVAFGNLFYLIAGLFVTVRLLRKYNVSNNAIALTLVALVLGTNMLNYVVFESAMSHVFSFFVIGIHVYAVKRYFESAGRKALLAAGFTLGLIILIRPINGIVVFSYFFLTGKQDFIEIVLSRLRDFLLAGFIACSVIFIQLLIWKLEIGQFLVYGYKNEGFYFNQPPPMLDYLLSFKRGALIYSPVLLLAPLGFWKMRAKPAEMLWLLFFLLLVVFVHASWWSWYYGDGFGERPLIDFYILFALLLGMAFDLFTTQVLRYVSVAALLVLVFLHQVFFYQYTRNIIHAYSMDFEKFKYVFLKTSKNYRNLFRCETEDFYHPRGVVVVDSLTYSLTNPWEPVPQKLMLTPACLHPGEYYELNDTSGLLYQTLTDTSWLFKWRYAEVDFDYFQPEADSSASKTVVYVTMDGTAANSHYYNANALEGRYYNTANEWRHDFDRIKIGIPEQTNVVVHVFLQPAPGHRLFIRNLRIKIVEAKN